MQSSRKRTRKRPAATLFDAAARLDDAEFAERVRSFAVEVAKRHRHGRGDLGAMLAALRGWHRTWAICAPQRIPQHLDDASVARAVAAYEGHGGARRSHAAA
jgi:hypothetical protein